METDEAFITRTIGVLEDWYLAMENGVALYRFPSAGAGTSAYSDAEIDRIIAAVDEEIDGEIERNKHHWNAKGIFRGCGFAQLAPLQRRALVEDLGRAVAEFHEAKPKPEEAA